MCDPACDGSVDYPTHEAKPLADRLIPDKGPQRTQDLLPPLGRVAGIILHHLNRKLGSELADNTGLDYGSGKEHTSS